MNGETLIDALRRQVGEGTALIDDAGAWTYAVLLARTQTTAAWLGRQGIRAGDRVMLVGENCRAMVALYLALLELGAWPILLSARVTDRELADVRRHSGARTALYVTAAAPRARQLAAHDGATLERFEDLGEVALAPIDDHAMPEAGRLAAMLYTSGTTGEPKGVMLSHRAVLFVARTSGEVRRLTPSDHVYAVLPISHVLGLVGVILASLLAGATLRLASRFDPAAVLRAIADESASFLLGTPAMYGLLAEYAGRNGIARPKQPALRLISTAGAPLDQATKQAAETLFGRPLYNGYGISECGPTVALTPLDAPRADCSVGRLLPGIEARLVGADGEGVGELWLKTPGVMDGYYKAPEATAEVLDADGWFNTRDLARFKGADLFIVGRTKELIIRFGFNVYPAEIEAVLNAHPAIVRSAVVSRPGEAEVEIVAFVETAAGSAVTPAELMAYAAENLATYKRPSDVVVLDQLPSTPAGKVLKAELAERARTGKLHT